MQILFLCLLSSIFLLCKATLFPPNILFSRTNDVAQLPFDNTGPGAPAVPPGRLGLRQLRGMIAAKARTPVSPPVQGAAPSPNGCTVFWSGLFQYSPNPVHWMSVMNHASRIAKLEGCRTIELTLRELSKEHANLFMPANNIGDTERARAIRVEQQAIAREFRQAEVAAGRPAPLDPAIRAHIASAAQTQRWTNAGNVAHAAVNQLVGIIWEHASIGLAEGSMGEVRTIQGNLPPWRTFWERVELPTLRLRMTPANAQRVQYDAVIAAAAPPVAPATPPAGTMPANGFVRRITALPWNFGLQGAPVARPAHQQRAYP
jgi:hypothetical protein